MLDLTPLLQALIGLAATAITAYTIPFLRSKTSNEKLEKLKGWAEVGVKAAEMIYDSPYQGEKKKTYVIQLLREHGFHLDMDELTAFIESAVNDMKSDQGFLMGMED